MIEQRLGITLANAMAHRMLSQASMGGFSLGAQPDPIWGDTRIEDVINTQLGAMGVV
jgi:hypothetical protein